MNVLQIVTWYSDYHSPIVVTGIFHQEQTEALQKHCQTAIWFPFDNSISSSMTDEIEWGIRTFRTKKVNGEKGIIRILKDFKMLQKRFHVDLIHAHNGGHAGRVAWLISYLFHIPYIVTEHSPVPYMRLDELKIRFQYKLVYSRSKRNLCVSDDLRGKLSNIFPGCFFQTMYNGVRDPEIYINRNGKVRQVYSVDGKVNVGVTALLYDREVKGIQYLLPAISQINKTKSQKIHLHLCGGGKYLEEYIERAHELKIEEDCTFHGTCSREKLYAILDQMDFGVSSSLFESAGVAVEEYLMLGKPMVVTRSGGASSLVSGKSAIIVEPGSTEALVDGITEMCERYMQYDGKAIREKAMNDFEMTAVVGRLYEVYQKCIDFSQSE